MIKNIYEPVDWSQCPQPPYTDIGLNASCILDIQLNDKDDRKIRLDHLSKDISVDGAV